MLSALIVFSFTVNHERDPRSFKYLLEVSCSSSCQALVLAEHKLRDRSSVDDVKLFGLKLNLHQASEMVFSFPWAPISLTTLAFYW